MDDEGPGVAQIGQMAGELQVVDQLDAGGFTAFDSEPDDRARTARDVSLVFRKNRGWIPARAVCQVSDRGRVRGSERCEIRRLFSW